MTNFKSMGLNEANGLFLLTVSKIAQTSAQNLKFKSCLLYTSYCGCVFPEGVLRSDVTCVFDHEQIKEICFSGFKND